MELCAILKLAPVYFSVAFSTEKNNFNPHFYSILNLHENLAAFGSICCIAKEIKATDH